MLFIGTQFSNLYASVYTPTVCYIYMLYIANIDRRDPKTSRGFPPILYPHLAGKSYYYYLFMIIYLSYIYYTYIGVPRYYIIPTSRRQVLILLYDTGNNTILHDNADANYTKV